MPRCAPAGGGRRRGRSELFYADQALLLMQCAQKGAVKSLHDNLYILVLSNIRKPRKDS